MLARGDYIKPPKRPGPPPSQSRQERKKAEICGHPSAKQLAKTEKAWSRADVPANGLDAAWRCEIRRRRR